MNGVAFATLWVLPAISFPSVVAVYRKLQLHRSLRRESPALRATPLPQDDNGGELVKPNLRAGHLSI
jgi:hypothetical protein